MELDRMKIFINSLDTGNTKELDELETVAIQTDVPIVRKDMQSFLRFMMKMQKPMQILEVRSEERRVGKEC